MSDLDSTLIFPLNDIKAQLKAVADRVFLRASYMNFKNENWTGWLSTEMFYSKAVALINDLENVQKVIDTN